ncbi:DUF1266 domain-containing protein [Anaerolentibacter hominis]|uniref:DUF1266 domain-containing protein n=1 Tax=Anaerolentibacter hominis TaxID=3079009 RepID=UPI0031B8B1D4
MKKKQISILLAVVLLFSSLSLTGCGKEKVSDTVLWFNTAYAVLTEANKGDITQIGGYKKTDTTKELCKQLLEGSWDVTDRASADETLDWILTEGHRADFVADIEYLNDAGLLEMDRKEVQDVLAETDEETLVYFNLVADAYDKFGENAIDAWDYCRALSLLGFYYVADYYTKEESLDASLEIARTLQQTFASWDEMMESYLYGYQYWSEDDMNDELSASYARKQVYESLKGGKSNPYTLDWNLELTKDW